MRELEENIRVEQYQVENQKKEKHISTLRLVRGLKLFKYNVDTGDLDEVKIERTVIVKSEKGRYVAVRKGKAVWDDRCLYIQSLNKKNAIRKITQLLKAMGINYQIIE